MSDKLNIPAESWRGPRRRSSQMDPQMVRMGVIAASVLGVVALGAGSYALLGHRSHGIPVVEADSRPVRVRPDNPGGTMVEGADEQIMGGTGNGQADAMAPPAEAPAPQALRAQIEASHPEPPPAAALASQTASALASQTASAPPLTVPALEPAQPVMPPAQRISLAAPPAPTPSAVSALPETRPARSRPAATNVPTAAGSAVSAGGMQVQLGALDSEQAAMTEWQRLSKRMPDLLGSRQPAVVRADHDGKTIWRLRTGGFADIASATTFCTQIRSKGVGCAIASF
jgi:hypothetical protein